MKNLVLSIASALVLLAAGCGVDTNGGDGGTVTGRAAGLAVGDAHSCETVTDGTVKCWGLNSSGQLGDGTTFNALSPEVAVGITTASSVTAGGAHTCALLSDGTIRCWGLNVSGQLGNSTNTTSSTPVAVTGISNAVGVSAGGDHTCAVLSDGSVKCWGRNVLGQLGDGTQSNSSTPVTVSGISDAVEVSAGGDHTCAVLAGGGVRCWGANSFGQLGNSSQTPSATPVIASGVAIAQHISAGANHTCASLSNGGVQCWGDDFSGQLGVLWTLIGFVNITFYPTPVTTSFITTATDIAAGLSHTCAVLTDGTAKCWGDNSSGQLGVASNVGFSPPGFGASPTTTVVPVTVTGISSATEAGAGLHHTCARLTGGALRCWGLNNSGQLGDGTGASSPTPVPVID